MWLFALLMTFVVILGGAILIILLSFGVANPPRAGTLRWQVNSVDDWSLAQASDEFDFFSAPVALPSPPFTLELTGDNEGLAASAWGVRLQNLWSILISREGYLSVTIDEKPQWAEFPHIRRDSDNKLYLDVQADGTMTVRINDEIAWTGNLDSLSAGEWEIVHYQSPILLWEIIALYAPDEIH